MLQPEASIVTTQSVIGRSLRRAEGAAKVTGAAAYTADVVRDGALWAGFVRSPYPHARIRSIDASRALALPGGKGRRHGPGSCRRYWLASIR